jgi:hypothetical protein
MKVPNLLTSIILVLLLSNRSDCQIQVSNLNKASLKYFDKNIEINGIIEDVELTTGANTSIIDSLNTPLIFNNVTLRSKQLNLSARGVITIKGSVSMTASEIIFHENLILKFEGIGAKLFLFYSDHLNSNGKTIQVSISDYMKFVCEKKK